MPPIRRFGILDCLVSVVCIVLDITEIVLYGLFTLTPLTYVILNGVTAGLWFMAVLWTAVGYGVSTDGPGLGLVVLLGGVVECILIL